MNRPQKPDRPVPRRTDAERAGARAERTARATSAPEHERITDPEPLGSEVDLDRNLRPRSLNEFVGQESLREQLRIAVEAAKGRGGSGRMRLRSRRKHGDRICSRVAPACSAKRETCG